MRSILIFLTLSTLLCAARLPAQTADSITSSSLPRAYAIFSIRVQDWVHFSESADTVLRLVGIFSRNKARADFLIAGQVADKYARARPDVITALRDSNMTIGYHILPPHPACAGFDQALVNLGDPELAEVLPRIERFGLDPATGAIDSKRPGGYALVSSLFERPPVTVWPLTGGRRIHTSLCNLYEQFGTRMLIMQSVAIQEARSAYVFCNNMLIRPNNIQLTPWLAKGETAANAWWDHAGEPAFNPIEKIRNLLPTWKGGHPPYIVCEMDENVFVRRGPVAWTPYYYEFLNRPLKPPYNMQAADPSSPRTKEEQAAIWQAYEELVAYAVKNFKVVTSEDILRTAESQRLMPGAANEPRRELRKPDNMP